MLVREIKGLKFPDESVTRFFFKERLFEKPGRALELGCGNGNNLSLFYQYGYDVTGIDINETSVLHANENTAAIKGGYHLENEFRFSCEDMTEYVRDFKGEPVDILLMPSSLYYLPYNAIRQMLLDIKGNGLTKPGTKMFFRMRDLADYRFGKGRKVGTNSFVLDIKETNEEGRTITFFSTAEFLAMLESVFRFRSHNVIKSRVENQQIGKIVDNSDIIFSGERDHG